MLEKQGMVGCSEDLRLKKSFSCGTDRQQTYLQKEYTGGGPLHQVAELLELVRRLNDIREAEKELACSKPFAVDPQPNSPQAHTEGRKAHNREWKLSTARTNRRKRLPQMLLQNHSTALWTEEKGPVRSQKKLALT